MVAVALFALLSVGTYGVFTQTTKTIRASRSRVAATALAGERVEIIRNLPYASVGLQGGVPPGNLVPSEVVVRDGIPFTITTVIRNIDDPFDGILGGDPNDTSPADYKLAEISVSCDTCTGNPPLIFTTTVAPKNLESASTNGSLFVQVINASGEIIPGTTVHVENTTVNPQINLDDVTNAQGELQLVNVPPALNSYRIRATKSGYSTEQTYAPGDVTNPNPTKAHASVITQQLTRITMVIDKVSTMTVNSVHADTLSPIASIPFHMQGAKPIGTYADESPVYKYSQDHTTNAAGTITLTDVEWDTYTVSASDQLLGYDVAFIDPTQPIGVNPDTTHMVNIGLRSNAIHTLNVNVTDSGAAPLEGASVTLANAPLGYNETAATPFHGQVFFSPLSPATYVLSAEKSGYNPTVQNIAINGDTDITLALGQAPPPPPPPPPGTGATTSYTIGTRALNVDITAVAGSGPWSLLVSPADLSSVALHDKLLDEGSPQRAWKVSSVDDANNTITVIDSEANGGAPALNGVGQAALSRWFSTLAAWETARQGDLITRDTIEQGILYADSVFTSGALIDGSTTDSGHFLWITAAPGERHAGVASGGSLVLIDGQNSIDGQIDIQDSYTRVEWLEMTRIRSDGNDADTIQVRDASNVLLQYLLIHNFDDGSNSIVGVKGQANASFTLRNSLIYDGDTAAVRMTSSSGTATVQNSTIYDMDRRGLYEDNGPIHAINTIAMGNPTSDFSVSRGNESYNMSSDSSASGTGSLTNKSASAQFQSIASGSENLHLKAGANAYNAGADLSSSFTDDTDSESRPKFTVWDMGADEY